MTDEPPSLPLDVDDELVMVVVSITGEFVMVEEDPPSFPLEDDEEEDL